MAVLREIRANRPISRAQIAAKTGLSKPSVARGVEQLLNEGLIFEKGPSGTYSEPGRKPRGLVFNSTGTFKVSILEEQKLLLHWGICPARLSEQ